MRHDEISSIASLGLYIPVTPNYDLKNIADLAQTVWERMDKMATF